MISATEQVTIALAKLALEASTLTHKALAGNIAHANTPGYAPARVNFADQLQFARSQLVSRDDASGDLSMLSQISPDIVREANVGPLGVDPVRLDQEMALMSQNTIQYQALLEALSKKMGVIQMAIKGGSR